MDEIIRTHDLNKKYKTEKAVDNLNISVKRGEIYGFLGQNGAGKTTTIRMIMGLIKPTSGTVELFGESINQGDYKHFKRIGSIVEVPGYYPNLTAGENLDIHRGLMGIKDKGCIDRTLEDVGMSYAKNKKAKSFSLGMKQRLGIARALLHNPELLILDEPTNGLDPIGIKEVRQLIVDLAQKRKITIFISSHILSEVELLATKIGIIHKGTLLEEVDYNSLQEKSKQYIQLRVDDTHAASEILNRNLNIKHYKIVSGEVIRVYESIDNSGDINRILLENKINVKEISMCKDSLEDYFIRLTGGVIDA